MLRLLCWGHGHAEHCIGRLTAWPDSNLTQEGEDAAKTRFREQLTAVSDVTLILTCVEPRYRRTAELANDQLQLPLQLSPLLQPIQYGVWTSTLFATVPPHLEQIEEPYEGGECMFDVALRTETFLRSFAATLNSSTTTVACFLHHPVVGSFEYLSGSPWSDLHTYRWWHPSSWPLTFELNLKLWGDQFVGFVHRVFSHFAGADQCSLSNDGVLRWLREANAGCSEAEFRSTHTSVTAFQPSFPREPLRFLAFLAIYRRCHKDDPVATMKELERLGM